MHNCTLLQSAELVVASIQTEDIDNRFSSSLKISM